MKLATFNVNGVNGINGRLSIRLRWLEQAWPDVVCLQELNSPNERFARNALETAGYGAVWHGHKSWNGVAILARGLDPTETRRGLPGEPEDLHSRYIEAAVNGTLIGCLYLPNGNPAQGPKLEYKLHWLDRFARHATKLPALGVPVALAGDYHVIPNDLDVCKPERRTGDALYRPEVRTAFHELTTGGWTDALRTLHPDRRLYSFWRCCQTNANQSPLPLPRLGSGVQKTTPPGESGGAPHLVGVAILEMALRRKVVVNRGIDGGEFLQRSHAPEPLHRPLPSSERQVRVLGPVVEPAARFAVIATAEIFERGTTGP